MRRFLSGIVYDDAMACVFQNMGKNELSKHLIYSNHR